VLAAVILAPRTVRPAVRAAALVVAAWTVVLVALMLAGHPAAERFFVPPAALLCPVGAAGLVYAVRRQRAPAPRVAVAVAVAALLGIAVAGRVDETAATLDRAAARVELQEDLREVLTGRTAWGAAPRCGHVALPAGLGWSEGAVAWELGVSLADVVAVRHSARRWVRSLTAALAAGSARSSAVDRVSLDVARPTLLLAPFAGVDVTAPASRIHTVETEDRWTVARVAWRAPCPARH
jgi:xanthosine utilization system XapX-like protein